MNVDETYLAAGARFALYKILESLYNFFKLQNFVNRYRFLNHESI